MRFRLAKLGWIIACLVSPLFCSHTFAPLTSNNLQLFISLPLLADSIPRKSLSHQGPDWCCSGQGCEVTNWETDCISKGEKSGILWFAQMSIFLLYQMLMCLSHCYSHLQWYCSWECAWDLCHWYFFGSHTHANICLISLMGPYNSSRSCK